MKTLKVANSDIVVDSRGRVTEITGAEKLQQDIARRMATSTELLALIGQPTQLTLQYQQNLILETFRQIATNLQRYQQTRLPQLDPGERIIRVSDAQIRVFNFTNVVLLALIETDQGNVSLPFEFNCSHLHHPPIGSFATA